jgi:streptomycin 6-kinase
MSIGRPASEGRIELPPLVKQKALHSGPEGERWLADLPRLLAELEGEWAITAGESLAGGTAAYVARARTRDGQPVVLKIGLPTEDVGAEIQALADADGRGYVRLLASDARRRAMLQEALGSSLETLQLPPEEAMAILCAMLREAWKLPVTDERRATHAEEKAAALHRMVVDLWKELDGPCSERVMREALRCAERRASAFSLDRCVVVHGDSHPANALQVLRPRPGAEVGFVFVDPDGFLAEPAYDLGVVLRDWCEQVLAAEDPRELLRMYCDLLAGETGIDDTAIWEWAFVERVTSGLFSLWSGFDEMGRRFLESAERLAI